MSVESGNIQSDSHYDTVLRAAYPGVVASLTRILGDMDLAMDATQEAMLKALQAWPASGLPDSPTAWLVSTGRNSAYDHFRKTGKLVSLDTHPDYETDNAIWEAPSLSELQDDVLRLMFTCCHPNLSPSVQITLVLKVVLGFSTDEIARALLVSVASIEKRLSRARNTLSADGPEYAIPRGEEIPERLQAVLQAVYLLFNEGYTRLQSGDEAQADAQRLVDEATRLARMLCRLLRRHPDPRSLLALMLLAAARLPARRSVLGELIPLLEQDRTLWDCALSREGVALVDAVFVARHPPSAYQIQAAISVLHNQAASAEATDWAQIAGLYKQLANYDPSPVIAVNEAVALCMNGQCEQARRMLAASAKDPALVSYQPYYAALAFVSEKLGHQQAAMDNLKQAIALSQSAAQRSWLQSKLDDLATTV